MYFQVLTLTTGDIEGALLPVGTMQLASFCVGREICTYRGRALITCALRIPDTIQVGTRHSYVPTFASKRFQSMKAEIQVDKVWFNT